MACSTGETYSGKVRGPTAFSGSQSDLRSFRATVLPVLPRAAVLLILGFAVLPGCNRDGAEEPAIATRGAGIARIPMGAVSAVGVSFDVPPASGEETPSSSQRSTPHPAPPLPDDPFADPPTATNPDGMPATPGRRHRGTSL